MNKKLFVVLVVVAAMLMTISWAIAAKKVVKQGGLQKFELPQIVKGSDLPLPVGVITEPLAPLQFDQSNQAFDGVVLGGPFVPAGPGDMLWCCPIRPSQPGDTVDNQIVGCEVLRDTLYITGAGGTATPTPNYVYAYLHTTGDECIELYRQPQITGETWGWRDMACDGQYLYASDDRVLDCFYMTPGGLITVPANNVTITGMTDISVIRAVAWDSDREVFWTANFSSNIYGFNRSGTMVYGPYSNTLPLYGLAYDGTWLWCHSQDNTKIYQFDPNTGTYTGVVYSGCQDATGGIAGGLSMLSYDAGKQTLTVVGITQGTPDALYALEVPMGGPVGCCEYAGTCDMITEDSCTAIGGTWYAGLQCIGDECTLPVDTICHLQWDNGSASWYASSFGPGSQQGNYFNPETQCPDCGPDVYPFEITQVSGLFYDFMGVGSVDVIVHIYSIGDDTCSGPGSDIYSFPYTVTTFYPTAQVIPMPEVVCVNEDFVVAFELISGTQGSIPCVLWTNEPGMQTCISWIYHSDYLVWYPMELFWAGIGYHMIRADGICNSGACGAQPVPCDLIQDHASASWYTSTFAAGDAIAKYFDPLVYCEDPVFPYKIHDVEFQIYDFAGAGTVDIIIDVHMVCHDSCDGPGTQIYQSDPITVTDFYPNWVHLVLPEQVCVWEPFFISMEYASGVGGSTPSILWESATYPCDTCHAWIYKPSSGYNYWIEWLEYWGVRGCPMVRVSGFTQHPDCQEEPCDSATDTLAYHAGYAAWFWSIPDAYGDDFFNERFILPDGYGGRLDEVHIMFYGGATVGTPDADIYVWFSDGMFPLDNNPPYQAIGQFQIPFANIVWYPGWNVVQTWDRGITFDPGEMFHVGYSHADQVNEVLACLSDNADGSGVEQSSEYYNGAWGTMLGDWGLDVDFLIEAVICIEAPPESTFTISCSPNQANATPGDPAMDLFTVNVGSILGYNLNVDLSCTPPAGINVSFNPDNVPAPYTSNVSVSVDLGTPYGDYTLTFCGTGADGQGPICCNVTLSVQPPFDEAEVLFYHGLQRATNFGAVGNDAADGFVWYGLSTLFDGTFIVATTDDAHMALDVYNCEHIGWLPTQHMDCYYDPVYNANICYANFFTPESIISCEYDSVFIVGIMEECIDFSIKIKVYYNPTPDPIYGMYMSLFEDWDVGDAYNNMADMDPAHNLMWQYDPLEANIVFGMMKAPYYDDPMYNMWIVPNPHYVWPGQGFCGTDAGYLLDDLYNDIISVPGYGFAPWPEAPAYPDSDYSLLMTAGPIDLLQNEKHIEVWIDFGRNLNDGLSWTQWWHRVLRYAGFYRGDCNASDTLELPALDVSDLVYLIQYLFQNGPTPKPYWDQGDVNADRIVNVGDAVYLINYVFLNGPAPIDYVRFIPQTWPRESLFENPNWD